MEKLETGLNVEFEGIPVEWGRIPSGLIEGWEGLVYYFQTSNVYNSATHERVVMKVIELLQSQSHDHGSEWRKTKVEAVVWKEYCQITLVSFRIKDSY